MKNIVFKEQECVFVADFASEGNCVIQIDNGNVEPLKIYRHMLKWNQVPMMRFHFTVLISG